VVGRALFAGLGGEIVVAVTRADALPSALAAARAEVLAIDAACSRFREDSELTRLNAAAGRPIPASPLLREALRVAVRAAHVTDGIVVPTVGRAVVEAGYDRDFKLLPRHQPAAPRRRPATGGWEEVAIDEVAGTVTVPPQVALDLGATAKALAADRAAAAGAERTGCGVLVAAAGDVATAGTPPPDGWVVAVAEHHADAPLAFVRVDSGGVATSGTTARTWWRGRRAMHHLIDPRTGRPARAWWRTVTVAAASCVDANIASTAAVVLGRRAPAWLAERGLAARLVDQHHRACLVGGWPQECAAA